ncbi:MAG: glycosyltransferase family 4 protein [Hyphomonadaceae bacterium]|nr:glycosyltransferase family 4 protein [Hyphomonadaceae bacterium]
MANAHAEIRLAERPAPDGSPTPANDATPAPLRIPRMRARRPLVCAIGLRNIPGTMGGIETHCENLYPRLVRCGYDVVVLARSPYASAQTRKFEGVRVRRLWAFRHKYLETLLHTFVALCFARACLDPDILHLHAIGPGFFAPLSKLMGFKTIVTHHAPDYLRPKWGIVGRAFLRAGEFLAVCFADRVVCVNAAIRDDLVRRFPFAADRIDMIRNGAPEAEPAPAPEAVLSRLGLATGGYILAVGRLEATKGFHELVAAFERAEPSALKLVIVGSVYKSDRYARELLARASPRILFPGFIKGPDLHALYAGAAVYVHPSHMESFSLAILEALVAGAPVLLSDIPANREFDLEDEAYFPTGDVSALAARLAAGDWRRSERAAAVIAENNWNTAAGRYANMLASLRQAP